jgi:hypothetical protein
MGGKYPRDYLGLVKAISVLIAVPVGELNCRPLKATKLRREDLWGIDRSGTHKQEVATRAIDRQTMPTLGSNYAEIEGGPVVSE